METSRNPWYLRPFFGNSPVVPVDARHVLGLMALGFFFEQYDMGLLSAALPQISEDLAIPAGDLGAYLGIARLGGVGTFLLLPLADRFGRRRIFLLSLVGMSVFTLLTAFSQTPLQFAIAQFLCRTFLFTAPALALVIVVEEFPAEHRGAGLGLLTMLGGTGFVMCAALYAAVDWMPLGWRSLYVIGFVPVLLIPLFRRRLQETARFEQREREAAGASNRSWLRNWLAPIAEMLRTHPRRVAAVGGAAFLSATGVIGLFTYASYYLQEVHGWTPGAYSAMVVVGHAIGLLGNVAGGRASDRFGRRRVASVCYCLAPVFGFLFFFGSSALLPLAWGLFFFFYLAGDVVLRALSAELFSTSHRSTSAGFLVLLSTLGWASSLFVMGFLTGSVQELVTIVASSTLVLVVAGLVLLTVPETHRRELEAISEEPVPESAH